MGSRPELPLLALSKKTIEYLDQESKFSAGGFRPVPAVLERSQGSRLWDVDGKEYIDFISMFSATNLGHNHPRLVSALTKQMQVASLFNLAAHNAYWPPFAEMMCKRFGFDKIIAMTSGTEAADTAVKIARKWGIKAKGIAAEECLVLGVGHSYHGLGSGVWGLMDPHWLRSEYGLDSQQVMNRNPSTGESLDYLDLAAMERCLNEHHGRVAAVIMECLHGSSRTLAEETAYARSVHDLCKKHNVLFIADEVRQGAGKTGKFLSYEYIDAADFQPDIVTMGKSITGGMYPQSYVLGMAKVMDLIGVFQMASSYAMTPLAIVVTRTYIQIIDEENLMARALQLGARWKAIVKGWRHPKVDYVWVLGADSNLILKNVDGPRFAALCALKGLYSHPRPDGLRISFAMNMSDEDLEAGARIIREALDEVDVYGKIPGEVFPY